MRTRSQTRTESRDKTRHRRFISDEAMVNRLLTQPSAELRRGQLHFRNRKVTIAPGIRQSLKNYAATPAVQTFISSFRMAPSASDGAKSAKILAEHMAST